MPEVAYRDFALEQTAEDNLKKLERIASLRDNWDGYGACPIPIDTLYRAQRLISTLHIQPEIFPTATGSIQAEYEKDNGDYLELQFSGKGSCEVFRCIGDNEEYFEWPDNSSSVNALVDNFYGYSF